MKNKMIFLMLPLLIFSSASQAATVWLFEDVMVEDVTMLSSDGNKAVVLKLSDVVVDDDNYTFNCSPTTSGNVVAHWDTGVDGLMQALLSTALSAQAQGLKVDINVDPSVCADGAHWWDGDAPHGAGLKFYGIRVRGN